MKVKELIKKLKLCDKEKEVKFTDYCCNQEFYIGDVDGSEDKIIWLMGDEH